MTVSIAAKAHEALGFETVLRIRRWALATLALSIAAAVAAFGIAMMLDLSLWTAARLSWGFFCLLVAFMTMVATFGIARALGEEERQANECRSIRPSSKY